MLTTQKLTRDESALCTAVSWLEYIWNRDTENEPVAVLEIDLDLLSVALYSNDMSEVLKFKDKLKEMLSSIEDEVQNGYGGVQ